MGYSIAIDGPAGAGKSTIAKKLAKRLNFIYIDTGAMYRAMGLFFARNKINLADEEIVAAACKGIDIQVTYENGQQQIWLQGENVTDLIRTEEAGNMASSCAVIDSVRRKLVALQRKMAQESNVIMDGRDIGTVVLPEADLKIFLTADVETRAERRFKELTDKGESCNIDTIREIIENRDYRDTHRAVSPLRQAEDAVYLDSSQLSEEEVINRILDIFSEKTGC